MLITPMDVTAGLGLAEARSAREDVRPLTGRVGHAATARRARRVLAWDLAHVAVATGALLVVADGSRAVGAATIATALAAVTPATSLVTARLARRPVTAELPSGWQRAATVGFLAVGLALVAAAVGVAAWCAIALARGPAAAPPPGDALAVVAALLALAAAAAPSRAFAAALHAHAATLHDKAMHAEAERLASAWWIVSAGAVGVVALAAGWWWVDAAVGLAIAAALARSGARALRDAVGALLERLPRRTDRAGLDPVLGVVLREMVATSWVSGWHLRVREHGPQIAGEVLVEAPPELPARELMALTDRLHRADWRLELVAVAPVRSLPR